jgi:hypothetical protein
MYGLWGHVDGRTRAMAEQVKGRTSQWQTTIAYLISSTDTRVYLVRVVPKSLFPTVGHQGLVLGFNFL